MESSVIADTLAVNRLRYEYAFGIDTRDYPLLRSVFTDEIEMDFSSYNGGQPARLAADDWVARCATLFDRLDATQHTMTNPIVDIDAWGTGAEQRTSMQAAHFLDGAAFTIGGWYHDRCIFEDDRWKIAAVTLHVTWERGDREIMKPSAT